MPWNGETYICFVGARTALLVGVDEVGVPVAVGVVHLDDDAGQLAVAAVAPEDADRVEAVAEGAGVGGHQRSGRRRSRRPRAARNALDVVLDRAVRVAEVVACLEAALERCQHAVVGEVVEVDQPGALVVGEGALDRRTTGVPDRGRRTSSASIGRSVAGSSPPAVHVDAEPPRRLDAGPRAVLVEAPAVVGAGEARPGRCRTRAAVAGRPRSRGVDRVLVLHRVDDPRLVDEVLAAEGDQEAGAVVGDGQTLQPGQVVGDRDRSRGRRRRR